MVITKCVVRSNVGKDFWCPNLTTCKNIQTSENARLHAINVLWANISCQEKTNAQRMNIYGLVGLKHCC
jgi:hypothetical protein